VLLVAALLPPLFLVGLGYRLWRWIKTPDEATAKKQAARREQLKRVARRPALEMPVHSDLLPEGDDADPALNSGGEHEA
jgi:hypothetical protein